jgi:DNA-binding NarL/FixJ family response regulator
MKPIRKIKVLLADDTLIAREGWKRILETSEDISVVGEVTRAQEATRKVLELQPQVLLMDLKWFGDDTAAPVAIREIKKNYSEVKIIVITAYENLIRDARMAGADAALTKTFSRDDLLSLIRELANRTNDFTVINESSQIIEELTSREIDVLSLIEKGYSDKDIASSLGIVTSTVKNHVRHILEKTNAKNRTQAVSIAREMGLFK